MFNKVIVDARYQDAKQLVYYVRDKRWHEVINLQTALRAMSPEDRARYDAEMASQEAISEFWKKDDLETYNRLQQTIIDDEFEREQEVIRREEAKKEEKLRKKRK